MMFGREFSTPALSRERERSVLTPNPTGSVRGCFVDFSAIKSIKNFEERI